MAKEATLQVRMDAELKENVEQLYKSMGTTFAEAVRIFARQSVTEQRLPFVITTEQRTNAYGALSKYANHELMQKEKGAFGKAMVEKHEKAD